MELRRPTLRDKEAVLDLMAAFETSQSTHDGGFWIADHFDYEDWLVGNDEAEMGLNLSNDWVPAIQFIGFVENEAVGFLNLRLRLNDDLLEQGGHIGYSVRPNRQGRGYATKMLKQGLRIAFSKNIKRVLVTCDTSNIASQRVIVKNGGVLEDVREGTERYWIEVTDE